MATATQTYTAKYNAEDGQWDILDADGDVIDTAETRAAATAEIKRLTTEEEVERLTGAIIDRINEAETASDLDTLRRVAAMLGL